MTNFRLPTVKEFSGLMQAKNSSLIGVLYNFTKLKGFDGMYLVADTINTNQFSCAAFDSSAYVWVACTDVGDARLMPAMFNADVRLVRQGLCAGNWKNGDNILKRFALSSCKTFVTDLKTGLEWKTNKEQRIESAAKALRQFAF